MDTRTGTVSIKAVPKDASPQRIRMWPSTVGSSGQYREAVRVIVNFQRTDLRGRSGSAKAAAPFFFVWPVQPLEHTGFFAWWHLARVNLLRERAGDCLGRHTSV